MIWFKIEEWDYMDPAPSYSYRAFENDETAKKFEDHMNTYYSGGTTKILGYATQEEILDYVFKHGLELDQTTLDNINNKDWYIKF